MVDITIKTGFIKRLQDLPQKLYRTFGEFIDNSLESFLCHEDVLEKIPGCDKCIVDIHWSNSEITIKDNAYGMNDDDFDRAMGLNRPASSYRPESLSKYGMGLKYAAVNLGNVYSIESVEYKSCKRYFATIDVNEIARDNPTAIPKTINDALPDKHYTVIKITQVREKLTSSKLQELMKHLGVIYDTYLTRGTLIIRINDNNVVYMDPDLRKNPKTGSEYIKNFANKFEFNGKQYEYSGWIGILKTASVSDAGLHLRQAGRAIDVSWRPETLFGKKNDFRYQRITGDIDFLGGNWNVSFNKDGFTWGDDGLEEKFIASLDEEQDIVDLFKTAKSLRKDAPSSNPVRVAETMEERFSGLSGLKKPVVPPKTQPEKTDGASRPVANPTVVSPIQPGAKEPSPTVSNGTNTTVVPTEDQLTEKPKKPTPFEVTFENVSYTFKVVEKFEETDPNWLLLDKEGERNDYVIHLNFGVPALSGMSSSIKNHDFVVQMAVSLALARLSAIRLGLKMDDSQKFFDSLNQILAHSKKNG